MNPRLHISLFVVLAALLAGCDDTPVEAVPAPAAVINGGDAHTNRFAVQSFGRFNGGYANHSREIFVITDTKTGAEYLTVTGCGTTELWTETKRTGKTTRTRTVEE